MWKKCVAAVLSLAVALSLLPGTALAAGGKITPVLPRPINEANPDTVAITYVQGTGTFDDPELVDPTTREVVSGTYEYMEGVGDLAPLTKAQITAELDAIYLDDRPRYYGMYRVIFRPYDEETYIGVSFQVHIYPEQGAASMRDLGSSSCYITTEGYSTEWEYTGAPIHPGVEVRYSGATLAEGTDYTVSYGDNTEIGIGTVTVTGMGQYENSQTLEFPIVPRRVYLPDVETGIPYDGQTHTAVPASGDYTITGTNSAVDVGEYTVTLSLTDPAHSQWITVSQETTEDQAIQWSIEKRYLTAVRQIQLDNTAGKSATVDLREMFEQGYDPADFTFGPVEVTGINTLEPDGPAYVEAAFNGGVLTMTATGVDRNPYEDYDMCTVRVTASNANVEYTLEVQVSTMGPSQPGGSTGKPVPELTLTPSAGPDGELILTVAGLPEGAVAALSASGGSSVEEVGNGAYTVPLPDGEGTYTFRLEYAGSEEYAPAAAQCTVEVRATGVAETPEEETAQQEEATTTETDPETGVTTQTTVYPNGAVSVVTEEPGEEYASIRVTLPASGEAVRVVLDGELPATVVARDAATGEIIRETVSVGGSTVILVDHSADLVLVDNGREFADTAGHWAAEAVDFVAAREIFSGTGEDAFSPEAPMTRAMLMTVLARFDGADTEGGSVWYEKGMAWARDNGVSDGTNPDGNISREQLATMLYRYAGSPAVSGTLDAYPDAANVSGYAADAMAWAVEAGLVSGTGSGALDPQGDASRAQVATILMRFCENLVNGTPAEASLPE